MNVRYIRHEIEVLFVKVVFHIHLPQTLNNRLPTNFWTRLVLRSEKQAFARVGDHLMSFTMGRSFFAKRIIILQSLNFQI